MADCLFCKIVAGDVPSQKVLETDDVLAFEDINPAAPTHVLVIPKQHVASAAELGSDQSELLGHLFDAMARIAADRDLGKGYRIVTNIGEDGGQTVHHLHFHVIGGRGMSWPPG